MNNDLIRVDQHQELMSRAEPLDLAIQSWLHAKGGRSGSTHTARIYAETIKDFRAQLASAGLDLDAAPNHITLVAQAWADRGAPAPSTYNHRLAVVSSFYSFAAKRGMLASNPITAVERRSAQSYASAGAMNAPSIKRMLADIDRSEPAGLRDYALLSVALQTGRRLAEIAGMRWSHLHIDGEKIRIHFPRTKGGKTISDTLPAGVSRALLAWLHESYGSGLGGLSPDAPIWRSLSRNKESTKKSGGTRLRASLCLVSGLAGSLDTSYGTCPPNPR
jgi:site-specific recombinase XerD